MTKKIVKRTDANNETLYFYTHSDAVDVGEGSSTKSLTEVIDDTLHKSAQTLTNAEKTQVYANLGLNGVDDVPTENSNNVVRSGGVKEAIDDFTNRGFIYKGIAPVSAPLGEDKTFYIAKSGDYTAYTGIGDGSFTLNGIAVLTYAVGTASGAWTKNDIVLFDEEPTAGSEKLVKSGGIKNELALGAVYDVSAKNPTAGLNNDGKFESLSALLSDNNLNTLIPTSVRKGGMSIKFVQSSDNKYVQYRLMAQTFTTNTTNWTASTYCEYKYFGLRPDFVKTENGWNLVIPSNSLILITSFGNQIRIPATNLELTIGVISILVINHNTGIISTRNGSAIDSNVEHILGAYFFANKNAELSILNLDFEYTVNGMPFGIYVPKEKGFSIFGTPIEFIKNEDGWKLVTVAGNNIACFSDGTRVNIADNQLQLIIGTASILVLNTISGEILTYSFSHKLENNEVIIGSYYLHNVYADLSGLQAYFRHKIDNSFVDVPKEYKCFGSRANFVKNDDKWYLSIPSGSLVLISSDGKRIDFAETNLELPTSDIYIIVINVTTGVVSARTVSFVDPNTEHLLCSYYLPNNNTIPNIHYPTFEYCINGKPFNLDTQQKPFSLWGKKPDFIKTSNGWSLVVKVNSTVIAFDNTFKLIQETNLPLTVGTYNCILVANKNSGALSTKASGELAADEVYLGSYFLKNANSDLEISPLFEYTINGVPFGINEISFFGSKPDFVHSENGWDLKFLTNQTGIYNIAKNKYVPIPNTTLHLTAGAVSKIVINVNTGQLDTRPVGQSIDNSSEIVVATYFISSDSVDSISVHPLFEYTINGMPFGITTGDSDEVELEPVIPNDIFISDDMPTPIFKKSLRKNPSKSTDLTVVATTSVGGRLKTYEICEPTNLTYNEVGDNIKFTIEQRNEANKNIFKNIKVHKVSVASKSGATPKILMIGDSITHGNLNAQSSPIVKMNELLPSWYNVTPSMIGTFAPRGVTGEGRGFFSLEAMVGIENYPYGEQTYGFTSYGQTLYDAGVTPVTTQFQNPFTFPATSADLSNHPDWCFTNKLNYPDEPDGLSYEDADATQRANYHFFIFNFAKYLELWRNSTGYSSGAYTPDIITIALGTNDWQPGGIIDSERMVFAMRIVYNQIRAILPNVKIGIVTVQGIAMTLQGFWTQEIYKTVLAFQELLQEFNDNGDSNIYEIPLYANSSRWLAFDGHTAGESSNLSLDNNIQQQTIDANVHLLDGVGSDGYWQYMNSLITSIINLI